MRKCEKVIKLYKIF